MTSTELELKTKAIYIEQHKAYHKDPSIFDRFYRIASKESYYGEPEGFFRGKQVLDVGCGNTAYFQKAMHTLGANHVTCVDLGKDWIPELKSALANVGVPDGFCTFLPGTTTDLCDLQTGAYDFVASNGVIMHLDGLELAEKAMRELGRVTKLGGALYVYVCISNRGILDKYILPAVREAYREDAAFRDFIDGLSVERLQADLAKYLPIIDRHDPEIAPIMRAFFALFTLDTITFWQNVLQVPVQQGQLLRKL